MFSLLLYTLPSSMMDLSSWPAVGGTRGSSAAARQARAGRMVLVQCRLQQGDR